MKLKNIFFAFLLIVCNLLFYKQGIGLNFLIFHTIYLGYILLFNWKKLTKKHLLLLITSTIPAVSIAIYGDVYSLIVYLFSIFIQQGIIKYVNYQVISGFFFQFLSFFLAPIHIFQNNQQLKITSFLKKYWIIVTTIPVIILFITIYSLSNKLFGELIASIDLSFISFTWIAFNLILFVCLYGFIYNKPLTWLEKANDETPLTEMIQENSTKSNSHLIIAGLFLLACLNVILLLSNVLDIYSLLQSNTEEPLSHVLHQAINMLIFSIVLAISIVLFFHYKRELLGKKRNWVDGLTYAWVIQNMLLVGICVYKNMVYVDEYGLTLKRIGVYVYLALCLIGLAFTILKLLKNKTNWYYFNRLALSFIVVLALLSPIDWENYIIKYNIEFAIKNKRDVDWNYLCSFSERTLPQLMEWQKTFPNNYILEQSIHEKIRKRFITKEDWPSYTLSQYKSDKSIKTYYYGED